MTDYQAKQRFDDLQGGAGNGSSHVAKEATAQELDASPSGGSMMSPADTFANKGPLSPPTTSASSSTGATGKVTPATPQAKPQNILKKPL